MAETPIRESPTPIPTLLEQEREFLDYFSTAHPYADLFLRPSDRLEKRNERFRKKLDACLKNKALIERLNSPEQPSLLFIVKSEHGTVEALQVLLEYGRFEIEMCDHHKRTALSYAAELQKVEFTELLLKEGANKDAKDKDGRTPLSWAATPRQGSCIGNPMEQTSPGVNTRPPFSSAATPRQEFYNGDPMEQASPEININVMVDNRAEINSEDNEKRTPLIWAIMHSPAKTAGCPPHEPQEEIIKAFLSKERIKVNCQDNKGQSPLILAAKKENYGLMELLINKNADTFQRDTDDCTFLYRLLEARQKSRASQNDKFKDPVCSLVKMAGGHRDRRDKDGRTLLWWAVEFGDENMVWALLAEGADPNQSGENRSGPSLGLPFLQALEVGNNSIISLIQYFLGYRRERSDNVQKDNTLHRLIQESQYIGEETALDILKKALETRYNANWTDFQGKTPLYYAIVHGKERLALELIHKLGSKRVLDDMDGTGNTPLFYALKNKMENIVRNLMQYGANVDLTHSSMWFGLGDRDIRYIRFLGSRGFEFINQPPNERDLLPNVMENVLCLHKETDKKWSRLKQHNFPEQIYEYLHHASFVFDNSTKYHISVSFPNKENKENRFWGIEWSTAHQDKVYGFVTTIPRGIIPKDEQDLCKHFLEYLHERWEALCSSEIGEMEKIRKEQLEKQGRSRKVIQGLAQNSLNRAELRRCLQQHFVGLTDATKDIPIHDGKEPLIDIINHMNESVKARLDSLEQASKELLQIEIAWVSISETTSMRRLSWVTFIFLPLMFASSLFGMNINLLESNPDWKWYLVFGASSLLLTVAIWMVFKYIPIESWATIGSFLDQLWVKIRDFLSRQKGKSAMGDSSDVYWKV